MKSRYSIRSCLDIYADQSDLRCFIGFQGVWRPDVQISINDGKIAVSFRKLDLKAFYDRYQEYVLAEVAAEEEKDPEKQTEIKKAARSSFEEWMDSYTLP